MEHPPTKGASATATPDPEGRIGRWVGANVVKKDADRFVTGAIDYAADLIRPGTLYLSVLRSTHAHAAIRGIDAEEAKRAPGVVARF
ncbi:CO/xanthine dehydrogenase Mo-binding subunit [Bradyrhizobium sp. USDA 4350]